LDDLNGLRVADDFFLLYNGLVEALRAIEVSRTIEVVEARHGGDPTPVVERVRGAASAARNSTGPALRDGLRESTSGEGRNQKQRSEDLGKHDGWLNNVKLGLGCGTKR